VAGVENHASNAPSLACVSRDGSWRARLASVLALIGGGLVGFGAFGPWQTRTVFGCHASHPAPSVTLGSEGLAIYIPLAIAVTITALGVTPLSRRSSPHAIALFLLGAGAVVFAATETHVLASQTAQQAVASSRPGAPWCYTWSAAVGLQAIGAGGAVTLLACLADWTRRNRLPTVRHRIIGRSARAT
jgi:hypothetical protein